MRILGYGEDALTFWALTENIDQVLSELHDPSPSSSCTMLFRPSFGRSGGPASSEFGEFDFILIYPACIYLGESKWDRSPEVAGSVVQLRPEQIERHRVFAEYCRTWMSSEAWEWPRFLDVCAQRFAQAGISKPVPPTESLLGRNLQKVLSLIAETAGKNATVCNVLLIVDSQGSLLAKSAPEGFRLVQMRPETSMEDNFIRMRGAT